MPRTFAAEGLIDVARSQPEEGWAFEGAPLADGANVYVGHASQ